MSGVFLAYPSYGQADPRSAKAVFGTASRNHTVTCTWRGNSLLAWNFNSLYCEALNGREANRYKWFAMLHADIAPEDWWLDKLIAEAELHDADMLSAVVPIKDARGVTSTALAVPDEPFKTHGRLTMNQVNHPSFPKTFELDDCADALERLPIHLRLKAVPREALLVNTGCFVLRLDRRWSHEIFFQVTDKIICIDGRYEAVCEPEDWFVSRLLKSKGAKVMATKSIRLSHYGPEDFNNYDTWGQPKDN